MVAVHTGAETIQGRKLFKGGNYMRKYGMSFSKIFILIALGSKEKNHEYFILRAVTLGIYETKSFVCFAKRSGF